jgi:hypothetical protein
MVSFLEEVFFVLFLFLYFYFVIRRAGYGMVSLLDQIFVLIVVYLDQIFVLIVVYLDLIFVLLGQVLDLKPLIGFTIFKCRYVFQRMVSSLA